MRKLVNAEFFKLSRSVGYWIMTACSVGVGLFFALWFGFAPGSSRKFFGYDMLSVMPPFVLFHAIFTGAFTAVFLCGEFSGRTVGRALFCGLPRRSVFLSKLAAYFAGLLCTLSIVVVVPVAILSVVNGYGKEMTAEACAELLVRMVFFWLISSAMGGFFIFLAVLTKSVTATLGAGLGISYILLIVTSNYANAGIKELSVVKYSFICQMFILDRWESLDKGLFLGVALVTLVSTLAASTLIFERSELK